MTDVEPIHYLSATAVITPEGNRHLAFCGLQMIWGADRDRYQVANYADPTRVTCDPCMVAYESIYPAAMAQFRERQARIAEWKTLGLWEEEN